MARNCGHLSPRISSGPINYFMLMRTWRLRENPPWFTKNKWIRSPLSFYTSLPSAKEIGKDWLKGLLPGENVDWRAMITSVEKKRKHTEYFNSVTTCCLGELKNTQKTYRATFSPGNNSLHITKSSHISWADDSVVQNDKRKRMSRLSRHVVIHELVILALTERTVVICLPSLQQR